jgi:hypothetical protein
MAHAESVTTAIDIATRANTSIWTGDVPC